MQLPYSLRALAYRNYRLFIGGQAVSLIGTWMQQIALSWLVFSLTGSSFQLSLVLFFGQLPSLFLAPIAGALVERLNRHRVLLWTQSLAMAQGVLLAVLTVGGWIEIWMVWPLALWLGIVTAFDVTTRQAFLSEMVTVPGDLVNAIALNSSVVNGARLVGPALAAVVLAHSSAGVCFVLNAMSYLPVLWSLLRMELAPRPVPPRTATLLTTLNEGFRYVTGFVPIRVILVTLSVASMAGASYNVLLPEYSVHVLGGDASTLAMLSAANGAGALTAAILLARRKSVVGLGRWIGMGSTCMGGALTAFLVIENQAMAMVALFVLGFGLMGQLAASNTLLQTIADPDKRARVMSFYSVAFLGMAPLGSLATGFLAESMGLVAAWAVCGVTCLVSASVFHSRLPRLRALVRPIYERLNLVQTEQPIAEGIGTASELRLVVKE